MGQFQVNMINNLTFYISLTYNIFVTPVCWNWQTRRTQNPLVAIPCGFDPRHRHQKRSNFCLPKVTSFFIQAAGLVYHHASACISSPQAHIISRRLYFLRLDKMQHFVLMIYNSFGIDDIQGFALICLWKSSIILLKGVVISEKLFADIF